MRRQQGLSLGLLVVLILIGAGLRTESDDALAQSGGDYDVAWSVVGSGGDQFVSGGDYGMGFTLGQDTPPAISSGGDYQVVQGYWALAGFCYWMDIDCNCTVDATDVQMVANNWRCATGDGCYDDRHDVDGDGVITVIDVMRIAAQWGWDCS
jgi:hypothetical protein